MSPLTGVKDDIDALGILKVDILSLGMLTCIAKCIQFVNDLKTPDAPRLEMHTVPAEDPLVYEMISDADTIGVFQIESRAQMSMLPRLKPNKFYDLVIEVAIVRPGPIQGDMVHPYLRRREGLEPVTFPNEAMREVLGKTLGVPLFQEQAMRVAMVGAGFTADEADRLRRAMAAWKKGGGLDEFNKKVVSGMMGNGYTREYAEQCFNMLRGFGEYGFPESHSASFALLVYVSSWLKRFHPAAFCAAVLNSQPMGFYAPAQIVRDAREHGVTILPLDVNHSDWDCTLEHTASGCQTATKKDWGRSGPAVRLGLRMIKGLRRTVADSIVAARRCGTFTSLQHLARLAGLSQHSLRRLADADALPSLGLNRRQAVWSVTGWHDEQMPLFEHELDEQAVVLPPMPMTQEVAYDYNTHSLSLKSHPLALIRPALKERKVITAADLSETRHGRWVRVAGLVLIRQRPGTASGIVFETLEDETGIVNLIIRPHVFDRYRLAARHAMLVQADGHVERQGDVIHVMVIQMFDLSGLVSASAKSRDFH